MKTNLEKQPNKPSLDIIQKEEVIPCLKNLKNQFPELKIYLFGSILENTAIRNESDADILIIIKNKIKDTTELYNKIWNKLTPLLDKGIAPHIIIYNPKSHKQLLKEVKLTGLAV